MAIEPDPRVDTTKRDRQLTGKHRQYNEGRARRAQFLQHIRDGLAVGQACTVMDISDSAYRKWRQRYPQFAAEVDAARLNSPTQLAVGWTGGFASFAQHFFGHTFAAFHLRVVQALEQGAPGDITLVLLPPEHGKTTLLEDWCSYKLAIDPVFRITVGSEKQGHSKKILGRVKDRMMEGGSAREYVIRFGPFEPQKGSKGRQPWGSEYFNVFKKGTHDERDYSMQALGIGAAVAGSRADLLLIDDVQSRKSLGQTDTMVEQIRQDWLSRPGSKGRTVFIGTRVGEQDVYEKLLDAGIIDHLVCIPAIDRNGNYLWPERYSPEEYARMRRNVGEDAWWRNYMQQPRTKGDATFEHEVLMECCDPLRGVHSPPPGDGRVWLGLDPALGGGNSLTAVQFNRSMDVLDNRQDTGLTKTEEILERIQEMVQRYRPECLVVERNAFQRGLANDDRLRSMARTWGFRVIEHTTGENKRDENFGVAAMAADFHRQLISIPFADDPVTRGRMEPLIAELETWRPMVATRRIRQDRVMSLWFVWLHWRQRRVNTTVHTGSFTRSALPFSPTGYRGVVDGSPVR